MLTPTSSPAHNKPCAASRRPRRAWDRCAGRSQKLDSCAPLNQATSTEGLVVVSRKLPKLAAALCRSSCNPGEVARGPSDPLAEVLNHLAKQPEPGSLGRLLVGPFGNARNSRWLFASPLSQYERHARKTSRYPRRNGPSQAATSIGTCCAARPSINCRTGRCNS